MKGKTIWVDEKTHQRLRQLKKHPREPFNDVLKRLLEKWESGQH
jgi:predicted CopG family antitoxin